MPASGSAIRAYGQGDSTAAAAFQALASRSATAPAHAQPHGLDGAPLVRRGTEHQ